MRLTMRNADGIVCSAEPFQISTFDMMDKLAAYEDTGLTPEDILHIRATQRITPERLAEIVRAEFEKRLVILPCKVGDTVYYIDGGKSYKAKAILFRVNQSGLRVYCERHFMGLVGFEGIYGKTVFLTREEAEATLKEMVTDSNQVKEDEK